MRFPERVLVLILDHIVATFCEISLSGLFRLSLSDPALSLIGFTNMFPTLAGNTLSWRERGDCFF